MSDEKLRLVTHRKLTYGQQCAQLVHGMATFAKEHPIEFERWQTYSNVVVCLEVTDEEELLQLRDKATSRVSIVFGPLKFSSFHEPDRADELTCVVLQPDDRSRRLCKGLRLIGDRT